MGNSKLDDIRERLVIYDAPHIDRMPAGIYLEDVGDLLAVVEAAAGFMENTSAAGSFGDISWLYRWNDEYGQFRCLGCGSPLGEPHAENAAIPCYGRLLDEAMKKLTGGE